MNSRKIRQKPRMSAPKMGEYLEASAQRRERILQNQKFPPTFIQMRYTLAQHAIRTALVRRDNVVDRLNTYAARIVGRSAKNSFEESSNVCCAEAVRKFANIYPVLGFERLEYGLPGNDARIMLIEGVSVSVAPTVLLKKIDKNGVEQRGALMAVFRKGESLGERSRKAIVELLRQSLTLDQVNVRPELCVVVDVFSGGISKATSRGRRISEELASACREIAIRWPALGTTKRAA